MYYLMFFLTFPRNLLCSSFFFFNDTATTEIYTLSLHDALPICISPVNPTAGCTTNCASTPSTPVTPGTPALTVTKANRSEEHTSELQSHLNLVCRLLLEKKKRYVTGCLLDHCPPISLPPPLPRHTYLSSLIGLA